ncbi:uncharacterized protein G2W53_037939 [Senna tora]|uniref:Uncharacterized protein n=1 Tax=Senna tora TaxID=362788 RepID=A0A834SK99_9FABA|nr:uncharacterized protein G2W53_037939 [Senna tora]
MSGKRGSSILRHQGEASTHFIDVQQQEALLFYDDVLI